MSTARKLVLLALLIHFISMYLPYQDSEKTISPFGFNGVDIYGTIPERTGIQVKPYGIYVISALFIVFATSIAEEQLWRRYGYWVSFVLLLLFATGGAILRTSGGNLSLVSLGLVIVAAYLNGKDLRRKEG
jgi:hypothetical protein